jgi:YfiH family protein
VPFETIRSEAGVLWRRSSLLHGAGIPHAFSTRIGGVSPPPFDSLNLGLADAPGEADAWVHVQANWTRLLHACGLEAHALVRVRQVHGTGVLHADRQVGVVRADPPFAEADAIVTGHSGHAVSVRVADCAPLLLADPAARLVAAVHAGWRGVVGGIVPLTIGALVERGAEPCRLLAAIGPCIGKAAFEVGPEVQQAFSDAGLGCHGDRGLADRWMLDLVGAIRQQLRLSGLKQDAVEAADLCTRSEPATEFSYRRDGPRSGRMAAVIGLSS